MFVLDPQLRRDSIVIGQFDLSLILLMNDANYPWFILVPRKPDLKEIFHLNEIDQIQLIKESSYLAEQLFNFFKGDKINIAALGNIVSQLHIHHIVRYQIDAAWPDPIWGKTPRRMYTKGESLTITGQVVSILENGSLSFRAGTDETTHCGFSS